MLSLQHGQITADEVFAMLQSEPIDLPNGDVPWPEQGAWTYADYLRLPEDGRRYEIIEGVLYVSPAPKYLHQFVAGALAALLWNYVRKRQLGLVLSAPFEVHLSEHTRPLQPDIIFIRADQEPDTEAVAFEGVPDLVVEILSPSSVRRDRIAKFAAYEKAGVSEYWIVDPETRAVEVYVLNDGLYQQYIHAVGSASITSTVFPDLSLPLAELFPGEATT